MKTVGAYEAKTNFSRLLDEVTTGESITITRHGVPVARLVPASDERALNVDRLIEEWLETRRRENVTLGGLSLREMIEEGRM
jgi:prevent-host-death family protein